MASLRREALLWRLNRRLRPDVPYRRRRAIRAEVRANLGEAAAGSGRYAAVWTTLALLVVHLIRIPTFGMIDTFDAHTGQQEWSWGVRYLGQFGGDVATSTFFKGACSGWRFCPPP